MIISDHMKYSKGSRFYELNELLIHQQDEDVQKMMERYAVKTMMTQMVKPMTERNKICRQRYIFEGIWHIFVYQIMEKLRRRTCFLWKIESRICDSDCQGTRRRKNRSCF